MTTAKSRDFSIATRLTLFYTLSAMAALALFGALINWRLAANFDTEHLRFLQAKSAELQTDLDDAGGQVHAIVGEILKETTGTRLRTYQGRVLVQGAVLSETPGMDRVLPAEMFPPARGARLDSVDLHPRTVASHKWLLGTLSLRAASGPLQVQLALDVTRDDALLAEFRSALAAFFVLLIPLLAIVGRWGSARALAPVRRIAQEAGAITATRLSARIPEQAPWPRELTSLVDTINAMLTRLEEAFARLSRFSADLAHELRTPLSNLSGELEVCLTRPRSADDYRVVLESGLEDCRRLSGLIENLLFLARAEHAQQALRREDFDVAEIAGWVIAQHTPTAAKRGIHIELSGQARLYADVLLFRQALGNLLANALRYAPDASTVQVHVRSEANDIEVDVIDSGPGIAAEHQEHLFERFYQTDPARGRSSGQGTGLGLSIVRKIMELHGGTARIASHPDRGTTASLRFPRNTGASA